MVTITQTHQTHVSAVKPSDITLTDFVSGSPNVITDVTHFVNKTTIRYELDGFLTSSGTELVNLDVSIGGIQPITTELDGFLFNSLNVTADLQGFIHGSSPQALPLDGSIGGIDQINTDLSGNLRSSLNFNLELNSFFSGSGVQYANLDGYVVSLRGTVKLDLESFIQASIPINYELNANVLGSVSTNLEGGIVASTQTIANELGVVTQGTFPFKKDVNGYLKGVDRYRQSLDSSLHGITTIPNELGVSLDCYNQFLNYAELDGTLKGGTYTQKGNDVASSFISHETFGSSLDASLSSYDPTNLSKNLGVSGKQLTENTIEYQVKRYLQKNMVLNAKRRETTKPITTRGYLPVNLDHGLGSKAHTYFELNKTLKGNTTTNTDINIVSNGFETLNLDIDIIANGSNFIYVPVRGQGKNEITLSYNTRGFANMHLTRSFKAHGGRTGITNKFYKTIIKSFGEEYV